MKWFLIFIVFIGSPINGFAQTTLIYSNDVLGDLEPCGCRNNPKGGFFRKSHFLKSLPKGTDVIQVDTGDLFFQSETVVAFAQAEAKLKALAIVDAMNAIKHNLFVPGEKDFALGIPFFKTLQKRARFKFLGANVRAKNIKLDSFKIIGKSPRVGFIGVWGSDVGYPSEITILDPLQSIRDILLKHKSKADLWFVLSHQGLEADETLAQKLKQVELTVHGILGAHTQSYIQTPQKAGETYVFQSSYQNQYIGVLPLTVPFSIESHQLVGLDEAFDKSENEVSKIVAAYKKAVSKIPDSTLSVKKDNTKSTFQTFPRCAECHFTQFRFWLNTQHSKGLDSLASKNQIYNPECLKCHSLGLGEPNGFSSVKKAFESHQKFLPIESLADWISKMRTTPDLDTKIAVEKWEPLSTRDGLSKIKHAWAPIQCENCHQAGSSHPLDGSFSKQVDPARCLSCHTPERAPEWYSKGVPNWDLISKKRSSVTCPKTE